MIKFLQILILLFLFLESQSQTTKIIGKDTVISKVNTWRESGDSMKAFNPKIINALGDSLPLAFYLEQSFIYPFYCIEMGYQIGSEYYKAKFNESGTLINVEPLRTFCDQGVKEELVKNLSAIKKIVHQQFPFEIIIQLKFKIFYAPLEKIKPITIKRIKPKRRR